MSAGVLPHADAAGAYWRVQEAAGADGLAALGAPAARHAAAADAFYTAAWFDNLARHGVEPAHRLRVLSLAPARASGVRALLPLLRRERGAAAAWGPVLTGLSNFYSSLYGPIGAADAGGVEACRAWLRHVARHREGCGVIDLQPLDADGAFLHTMREALRAECWIHDTYFCFGNWYLEVGGRSFEAYYPTVPSRIRNTIRRARKKLDDAGDWSLRIHDGGSDALGQAIEDFVGVYQRSWKVPEPFPEFVPGLVHTAAREGWLRLGVVRRGDTPIAAQLWLVRDGHALIYKLAYDEAHKKWSGGSVLTAEMMRHAIDVDRVREIDYLTGDDAYKRDWMSHRRERIGLVAFDPRTLQGLASAAKHHAARLARRWRPAAAPAPAPEPAAPDADA